MLILVALVSALAVPAATHAADPPPLAVGSGGIASGDDFSSFAFAVTKSPDGSVHGSAVFRGLYGDPSASLVMRVNCLRTGVDVSVSPENTFVRQTFALASGEVVHASDSGLIGRTVLFGTIDGELTTGMADTDRIDADFAGLQPSVTCENAGLALLNPVVMGGVTVRQ